MAKDEPEQKLLKLLEKRWILHIWSSENKADVDPVVIRELVFSFFMHIVGKHEWNQNTRIVDLIEIKRNQNRKKFQGYAFYEGQ